MDNVSARPPFPASAALDDWRRSARPMSVTGLLGGVGRLLVLVPHADDETLGCGGLIAAASDAGIAVEVVVLTDGAGSHPGSRRWPPARLRARRWRELQRAVAILTGGRGRSHCLGLPDGHLAEATPGAGDAALPGAGATDLVVTTWRDDPHPDHQAAFRMAAAVARQGQARLLAFPLWVLTTACPPPADLPIHRIDIAPGLDRKQRALAAHASQLGALIDDDPAGFVLDAGLRALFVRQDEIFIDATLAAG